jgi:patatin-like phospholipase/acyl hydrolase
MPATRPFRILCIDGGGIRGIIPAIWLARLEQELKVRKTSLVKTFDLICGTSTGSIVGAAVATGTDIHRVIGLFRDEGPEIFSNSRIKSLVNRLVPAGLVSARYGSERLQQALLDVLGDARMGDVDDEVHLCIPSYDIGNRGTFYFKSYASNTAKTEIWRACLASSAAPTYFPAQRVNKRFLVDGGVSANNPSGVGLAEGIALLRKKSLKEIEAGRGIQLVSMGTGSSTRNLTKTLVGNKGAIPWANAILDVMFDGSSDVNDHIVEQILEDKAYVRLQFELKLGRGSDDLDNASEANLDELCAAAENYAERGDGADRFEEMLSMVVPPKRPR